MTPTARRLQDALDRSIASAHRAASEAGTAPHHATWGAAMLALPALTAGAGLLVAERPLVPAVGVFATLLAYNHGFMRLKAAVLPGARRQLLADLAGFCLPCFLGLTALLGESPLAMTDLAALVIPAGIVTFRLGCLLGGCCHGRASSWGVRYPGRDHRVLPLPLFEATVGIALGAWILAAWAGGAEPGTLLPRLAAGYGAYRFGSEFFRDGVGRTLGLTRSQMLAGVASVVGVLSW